MTMQYEEIRASLKARLTLWRGDWLLASKLFQYVLLAVRGKLALIDRGEVESKGGFRYEQLTLSKLPVSREHTYGP